MSFWDDASNAWNAATSGDWGGAADSVGNMFSGGTPSDAAPTSWGGENFPSNTNSGMLGAADTGSALGSLGDFTAGQGMAGLQSAGQNFPNIGDFSGGAPSAMGGVASDAAPTSWGGENFPSNTNSGSVASGVADSGGAGLLGKASDAIKKNAGLLNVGVNALGTLTSKNAPSAATTAGYNAASAANTQKAAVGNSLVNQAPFLANNAEAASKGAGANASAALQQHLQQQGYKPGDAMYDSAVQQQNIGNRTNDTTAYAAGQGQMASQMGTGAGLLTPNLAGYSAMGGEQNQQQGAQNKQVADLAGAAKKAYDIYSTPDTASTDGATT